MKRAERQHALLDILRATSPQSRSVRRLASELEVSTRTIERDIAALQTAGVPIYAEVGRGGGYCIAPGYSLPPLRFTPEEASALLAGLAVMQSSPYAAQARTAARKILAVLDHEQRATAEVFARGVQVLGPEGETPTEVSDAVREALGSRQALRIVYRDPKGQETSREIEPIGLLMVRGNWIVAAWCRLRQAVRGFRLDWIEACRPTGERVEPRDPTLLAADLERWRFHGLPE